MPEELKAISFETHTNFPGRKAICDEWLLEFPMKSMYLFGSNGTGKTTFAFSCVREAMKKLSTQRYFWPRYVTGRQLSVALEKASKAFDGDEWEIQMWSEVDLLLIDEIEKVQVHDKFRNQFFEIWNRREYSKRPTIITSNCKPKELGDIFDPAILSRLTDKTRWKQMDFGVIDQRKFKEEVKYAS